MGKFKLFFQRWRPGQWYWGYVFTVRQLLFACTFLIADEKSAQIFFVVVLIAYNSLLVLVAPWRLFEINVLEFMSSFLLVVMLISQNILMEPPATSRKQIENVFVVMFVMLLFVVMVYILRVCFASVLVGSPKADFVGLPKPIHDQKLRQCFEELGETKFDMVVEQILRSLTDDEKYTVALFFHILYNAGCGGFNFAVGMGHRLYVPTKISTDAQARSDMATQIKNVKQSGTESYI